MGTSAPEQAETVTMTVVINGTDANPYARYGLRFNPLPGTGVAEFAAAEMRVASLAGEPVRSEADIREQVGFAVRFPRERRAT